jgi:glycosyltransferase involved in cell wall biosynthesis
LKRIYFTVTNDLTYDQRMRRICSSLAKNGYEVILVGRKLRTSVPLQKESYVQKRLRCFFSKGKIFYSEYNLRLFLFLFFKKIDIICAIDLDTILPCLVISKVKRIPRVYDAHELFTELKEVISRSRIKRFWTGIEKYAVPKFKNGYTVSNGIATEFNKRYTVTYETIRNVPILKKLEPGNFKPQAEKFILYQGAVNEARGLEYLIPAMLMVDCKLVICGDGNFMDQLKQLIAIHKLENKIELKGMMLPDALWELSRKAYLGVAVPEGDGLNQFFALPNKFFDYIHACLPQVTVNYPEYRKLNEQYNVAVLVNDLDPATIAAAINSLLNDAVKYNMLKINCSRAREELNWENEQSKLLSFYHKIQFPA